MLSSLIIGIAFNAEDFYTDNKYYSEESLKGFVNINFSDNLASDYFKIIIKKGESEISVSGKTLLETLISNDIGYSCNPKICEDDYILSSGEESKKSLG